MTKRTFGITMMAAACATLSLACDDSTSKKDAALDAESDASADSSSDAGTADDSGDAAEQSDATDATLAIDAGDDSGLTTLQARGKYLVDVVVACGDCHTPQGPMGPDLTMYLAGNPDFAVLPNGDKLGTRNLTNDVTGLKNRTEDEIKNMFQNGMRPLDTGGTEALNPIMPYYLFHNMEDADASAIVAYLRTVPAVSHMIPRRGASFDVQTPAAPLNLDNVPVPADTFPEKDSAMRGRYLAARSGLCIECHTKHLMPGSATVLDEAHVFEGMEDFSAFFASTLMIHPVSKNLTSDNETGLGTWSAMDIANVLSMGKAKDGSGICPPMPIAAYHNLQPDDATDIVNYIRSLPPKTSMIVDMCSFPPTSAAGDGGSSDGATDTAPDTAPATDAAADVAADAGTD